MDDKIFYNDDIYSERLARCPLCGGDKIRDHFILTRYSPPFKTSICAECSFIFMNPRFNDDIIAGLYTENYYRGNAEYSYYDEREAEKYSIYVWRKRLEKIREYSCGGNFLDVGCAFGGFLQAASSFYKPFGIEMSKYSGEHARSLFGDNIHIGSLDDNPFSGSFFSVITMIELIEHLKDPADSMKKCYELLMKNGLLVIQTANMNSLQAKFFRGRYAYYMPGHLSYFTRQNLTDLLKRTGFSKVKVFQPVEFGLLPKLLKSRYNFNSTFDYYKWARIALYHFAGKIRFGNTAATASMVVYAVK